MSDDIRAGDLVDIRYDGTETRIVGRVEEVSSDGSSASLGGLVFVAIQGEGRTVTILERPEPPMEPLPTEFGAHIVATVRGVEGVELVLAGRGDLPWCGPVLANNYYWHGDADITAWRWAENPRPLPTVEELREGTGSGVGTEWLLPLILNYLREGGWGV